MKINDRYLKITFYVLGLLSCINYLNNGKVVYLTISAIFFLSSFLIKDKIEKQTKIMTDEQLALIKYMILNKEDKPKIIKRIRSYTNQNINNATQIYKELKNDLVQ